MKTLTKITLTLAAAGALVLGVKSQDAGGSPPANRGPGPRGHRPPPSPLLLALDVNHDGVIDADEIANAPAALRALDKNGDGKLTRDEFAPPPPRRGNGPDDDRDFPPDGAPPGPPPGDE
jgi:hypothetical protein